MPPRVVRPPREGEGDDLPVEITPEFMQCLCEGLQTAMATATQAPPLRPTSAGVAPDQMRELIDAIADICTAAATAVTRPSLSSAFAAAPGMALPSDTSTMNLLWASRSMSKANALYLRNGQSIQKEQ